jgi:hypothetical protein
VLQPLGLGGGRDDHVACIHRPPDHAPVAPLHEIDGVAQKDGDDVVGVALDHLDVGDPIELDQKAGPGPGRAREDRQRKAAGGTGGARCTQRLGGAHERLGMRRGPRNFWIRESPHPRIR